MALTPSDVAGPLNGVTIIDLTRVLAGPFCTMVLSELGARVIKVEPQEGDRLRRQPPNATDDPSPTFQTLNANKESVAISADSPALQALIG